jgi:hypothetical protein
MTRYPSNAEVIGAVVLTVLAVTFIGIGAITAMTWVFG